MDPEGKEVFLIKTSNPVNGSIMTYKTSKKTILVGSDSTCELIVSLPSISPVHLIVDFNEKKIKAVGNDVRSDYNLVVHNSFVNFNNKTLISIHNIFFMFISINDDNSILEESKEADNKLLEACSKYIHYSPYLKITSGEKDISLAPEYDRNIQSNRSNLSAIYEKEMGEFSEMPPLSQMEDQETINPAIKKAEEEYENMFDTTPSEKEIEAVIDTHISEVKENIQKAIEGVPDIKVVKEDIPDLGKSVIDNQILNDAKKEIEQIKDSKSNITPTGEEQTKILEAELKSIDDLRNSITDKIKDEFRSVISDIVHEETKECVGKEVERCFQEPKFAQFVTEAVSEQSKTVIEDFKNQIENIKETQEKIIESNNSNLSSEDKNQSVAKEINEESKSVQSVEENEKTDLQSAPIAKSSSKKSVGKSGKDNKLPKELEAPPAKRAKKAVVALKKSPIQTKKTKPEEKASKESEPEKPSGRVSERKKLKSMAKIAVEAPNKAENESSEVSKGKAKDKKTPKIETKTKTTSAASKKTKKK